MKKKQAVLSLVSASFVLLFVMFFAGISRAEAANEKDNSEGVYRFYDGYTYEDLEHVPTSASQTVEEESKKVGDAPEASEDAKSSIAKPVSGIAKSIATGSEEEQKARAESFKRLAEALRKLAERNRVATPK